jgi:hypothetical protein
MKHSTLPLSGMMKAVPKCPAGPPGSPAARVGRCFVGHRGGLRAVVVGQLVSNRTLPKTLMRAKAELKAAQKAHQS